MKGGIYVIKMKQIIKAAITLVFVIGIIMGVVFMLEKGTQPTYSPGTYSAQIVLHNSPVSVEVTVSKHSIEKVELVNMEESQEVFYPLFNTSAQELAKEIVAKQSVDIAPDSNYTVTGGIILDAVRLALEKAQS